MCKVRCRYFITGKKEESALVEINRTALYDFHSQMGGKIVPFAGYEMPVQYGAGIMQEHLFCRGSSALFDVSHMGQIIVRSSMGRNDSVAEHLEKLIPVDLKNLGENRQRYGFFLNDDGGIIDDLMITNKGDHFLIVANAARKDIDMKHLNNKIGSDVDAQLLEGRSLIAIQGPKSEKILNEFFRDISKMNFLDVRTFSYKGKNIWISRSGYTGEDGFEISIEDELVEEFATDLLKSDHINLAGLGARDSLRLEGSLCLYGQDIKEDISPVEARLTWAIQKSRREDGERGRNFLGATVIYDQMKNGVDKVRVGLIPEGKAPVRSGTKLYKEQEGKSLIGEVTSGGYSPSLGKPISMGYIFSKSGEEFGKRVFAEVRGKLLPISIVDIPFLPNNFKRK